MEILAIIPARGGSKGVPLKNIKKLNKIPLIEYSIIAAKKSKLINRVIVSTDNKKIAKISRELNAEVPFLRPKKISGDYIPIKDVVKHVINFLRNQQYFPDVIVILQPTSPFRTSQDIDIAIKKFLKNKPTSLVEVKNITEHPYKSFKDEKKYLNPLMKNMEEYHSRQLLPKIMYPTGSIYIFWRKTLEKFNSIYGNKILGHKQKRRNIDLDTDFDFYLAEMLIKYQNKNNQQ